MYKLLELITFATHVMLVFICSTIMPDSTTSLIGIIYGSLYLGIHGTISVFKSV